MKCRLPLSRVGAMAGVINTNEASLIRPTNRHHVLHRADLLIDRLSDIKKAPSGALFFGSPCALGVRWRQVLK